MTAPWGRVDGTPRNFAYLQRSLRITLTIYPPGVTPRERRLLNVRKLATTWTGFVSFSAIVTVVGLLLGITAVVASAVAWAVLGVAVTLASARVHMDTRCVRICATPVGIVGQVDKLERIAEQLDSLDAADLDPVNYEAEWGRIYRQLDR
ncbi:MAG TPA: DUF6611 family protein [Mycobacterium sp.]